MSEGTDKIVTKKDSEQPLANHCDGPESKVTEGSVTSRRTFTRNVLVGSAVLLTLTNRSAWGANFDVCVSTNLWNSYTTGQPSALTFEQDAEVKTFEQYLGDDPLPPDVNGDMCIKVNQPNVSSDNTTVLYGSTETLNNQ